MVDHSGLGNTKQVCARFNIPPRTLKDLRMKRAITYYRINSKTILYDIRSLNEYLQRVKSESRFNDSAS